MISLNTKKTAEAVAPETAPVAVPVTFSKAKILTMRRFAKRRDLLSVLLKENQQYTIEQVNNLINDHLKGKVK